ncbi:uncharacterized protein LOC128959900 [Oppia nitens]|uniref:uncharacterized protein LOC128959900 n=1 Tax=Oppia nitens TaxID=1686743 RepID=UPI0023D9EC41|nr:uncharacterized protein LOC128959900 [Oppia nitens]
MSLEELTIVDMDCTVAVPRLSLMDTLVNYGIRYEHLVHDYNIRPDKKLMNLKVSKKLLSSSPTKKSSKKKKTPTKKTALTSAATDYLDIDDDIPVSKNNKRSKLKTNRNSKRHKPDPTLLSSPPKNNIDDDDDDLINNKTNKKSMLKSALMANKSSFNNKKTAIKPLKQLQPFISFVNGNKVNGNNSTNSVSKRPKLKSNHNYKKHKPQRKRFNDDEVFRYLGEDFLANELLYRHCNCVNECEVDELTLAFYQMCSRLDDNQSLPKHLDQAVNGVGDILNTSDSELDETCDDINDPNLANELPQAEEVYNQAINDNFIQGIEQFLKCTDTKGADCYQNLIDTDIDGNDGDQRPNFVTPAAAAVPSTPTPLPHDLLGDDFADLPDLPLDELDQYLKVDQKVD